MDKSREARRPAMAASNGLLRRRSRSSAMRDSLDDGHAARQHGSSLIDRVEKRERDRDSLNRTKRRRSDRILQKNEKEEEEGGESSDDSFSADDETPQNTASFQGIHRNSLPLPSVSRTFKVAEEMIGVPVPRKARSACVKRSHEYRTSSASVSPASQSFEAGSPSSSNVSVKQKMMSNGSKNRHSRQSLKSSISAQNDLEIEIAEVLSGLKQTQSSKKEDETENSVNPIEHKDMITPNHDANASPMDSRKTKVKCEDSADLMKTSLNTSAVKVEIQRPVQMASSVSDTRETDKSNAEMKQDTPKLSIEEGFRLRDCSENKETFDSKDSTLIKGKSGGSEFKSQREDINNDKFKIDLMAPPFNSMSSWPERDAFVPPPSDFKRMAQTSDMKENLSKDEKVATEASREKKENGKWLKLDLKMPFQNDHKDCRPKLLNQGPKQQQEQQLATAVVPKSEFLSQPNSVPMYNAVGSWANDQKSFGYMTPPFQTIKPVTGANGFSPALQATQFITYQSRPKRSATHCYIAHNIQLHQQSEKTSTGSDASLTGFPRQSNFYAKSPPADQLLNGNSSLQGTFPILSLSSSQAGGQVSANITPLKNKASDSGTNFISTTQKKQIVSQQAPRSSPVSQLPGQQFIFPVTHHHQSVAATTNQPMPSKSAASTKISSLADNSASVSFNFQSSAASEAPPYLTMLSNNGYPFPVPSQTALKSGSPANAVSFFNGSFYSSHVSVPSQYQQQQQAHRDTSTSNGPSSSHKQPSQANTMQKQQLPSTHHSLKLETKTSGEKSSAVSDSWNMHNQKGPYSQISTIPVQPFNFSMSFAPLNGSGTSSNFNFSTVGQNPAVVQANRYHMVAAAPQSVQQKNHVVTEPKNVDGKKIATGKTPTIATGQTLVFDNSARNLNFISTPVTGGWPHRTVTAAAIPSASSVYSSVPNFQPIQIQKHHLPQQQTEQSVRSKSTATTSPSLTAGGSFNHKQFQQIQRNRTQQGETQISFSGNPKPVVLQSQGQQQILHSSQSQQYTIAASPNSTANSTGSNKTGSSAPKTQSQQTDSSSTAQKSSPVCGRNVPSIISSSPGQLSELK